MSDPRLVPAPRLHRLAVEALVAVGMPDEHAQVTADALVWGDLHGQRAHGVVRRLRQCVERVLAGGVRPDPRLEVVAESDAFAVLDGGDAWGQVATTAAMRRAMETARRRGVGAVAVRDTGSPAALGYYAHLAAEAGMVGLAVTNAPALVAAPGGSRRVLGNQAHAIGCPTRRHPPVVFDSALTLMSTGEMDRRKEAGEPLPEGVLLDEHGDPTVDPADWVTGTLTLMGGYRGFGLALGFEVLTSVLGASDRTSADVGHPFVFDERQGVSVFCLAVDPAATGTDDHLRDRVDALVDQVLATGTDERPVRVPGHRGHRLAEERTRDGVPVTDEELAALRELADRVGVEAV